MAKVIIEVKKNNNENNMSLIRRFTRKVQESRVVQQVKGKRYNERPISKLATKAGTLKRLARRKENEKLAKMGKPLIGKKKRR